MSRLPFVLADQDRVEQFALLAQTRQLFRQFDTWRDQEGQVWATTQAGNHCFATSHLGPNWVLNPYARRKRADILAERRRAMASADEEQQGQELSRIVSGLRLGGIAERVLWAIHLRVMQARRSVVRIPEHHLAQLVWGAGEGARPRRWRETLREVLAGLAWFHVARQPEAAPSWGQDSALLTHFADLKGSQQDGCDDDCPHLGGSQHSHFLVNIGRGFLGLLEKFACADDETGIRNYEFKVRGKKNAGPTLASIGRSGRLVSVYHPARLGEPARCSTLNQHQHRLLQAIVRETTRKTKAKRSDLAEADVNIGNKIPTFHRRKTVTCDLLKPEGRYVGFNGNGKRRGLGYGLLTDGGWMVKAGYDRSDVTAFLNDLAVLVELLGLIPAGIHVPTGECLDLNRLHALSLSRSGRQTLRNTHLRIYSEADYVQRWNAYFGWTDESISIERAESDSGADLAAAIQRKGIKQRAVARAINIDPSFLSKLLRGERTWPADKLQEARSWVAEQGDDQVAEPDVEPRGGAEPSADSASQPVRLLPRLTAAVNGKATMLDVALGYHSRGWSVLPQNPGAKQPCVKWKPFQQQRPTEEQLAGWFAQWPQAGLAVVLGPVSGLLVVDVDGSEAHQVLIERLGREPSAPKVISGSRRPDRYHLFFQCPQVPTKAKTTPWHPKLLRPILTEVERRMAAQAEENARVAKEQQEELDQQESEKRIVSQQRASNKFRPKQDRRIGRELRAA